jgi:hypothetical protein
MIEEPIYEEHGTGLLIPDNRTFLEKHKNHLLIAGALVLAFLAYKKFK